MSRPRAAALATTAAALLLAACQGREETPGEPIATGAATPSATAPSATASGMASAPKASACLIQGAERLQVTPLRAVGTEPFWGARIAGRCVTYSTPEDLAGTRVWTRYTPAADGGVWRGALGGRTFELTTRAAPGCSDGMSDRRYPIAVTLLVGGERRTGCAEPL